MVPDPAHKAHRRPRGKPRHAEIAALAKRYRAAFSKGKVKADGSYEVNHSSAIYVFDRKGHARLLATPATSNADLIHDLHLLITMGKKTS